MPSYLYKIQINKYNSTEKVEDVFLIAEYHLQAARTAEHHVFEELRYPQFPVEIVSISRIMEIGDILNANVSSANDVIEEIVENPLDLEGVPDDHVIRFKHPSCGNMIEVVDDGWERFFCPDCQKEILRNNLSEIAGIWVYNNPDKKRKKK